MGDPAWSGHGGQFRSFTGLVPLKAPEIGETDHKGQRMPKPGSLLLRTTMVRAANTGPQTGPHLARIYHLQMT